MDDRYFRAALLALMWFSTSAVAQISGTVFRDFNANGVLDATEQGIGGIEVTAFDAAGAAIGPVTTGGNGSYSIAGVTGGVEYRIEFTIPSGLTFLAAGPAVGAQANTSVVFAAVPAGGSLSGIDVAVNDPVEFCQANPGMAVPCYVDGDPLDATPGPPGTILSGDVEALVSFNYNSQGNPFDGSPGAPAQATEIALASEIGSTWGVAYQRTTQRLFAASFIKRYVGLGPGESTGTIFIVDPSGINPPTEFIDLNDIAGIDTGSIGTNAARGLPNAPGNFYIDPVALPAVATLGLGDIDISADDSTLWTVNLNSKTLYSIIIDADDNPATAPVAADITAFPIVDPVCTNGEFRPFAVKAYRGDVYVGMVCDGSSGADPSSNADLEAIVQRLSGGTFSEVLRFSLDYTRGNVFFNPAEPDCSRNQWFPWTNDELQSACSRRTIPFGGSNLAFDIHAWPQPVLSDIEFDVDGSMILGFFDRTGSTIGNAQEESIPIPPGFSNVLGAAFGSGDVLRAANVAGVFELEQNGTVGGVTSAGADNNQGPGDGMGNFGEFYFQDNTAFEPTLGAFFHEDGAFGGLALLPGQNEVALTTMNTFTSDTTNPIANSGGINWYSSLDGTARDPGYLIYPQNGLVIGEANNFSKANGLGDIELMCDPAPIQIGNFIWMDTDNDGIQDPGEMPIDGVTVHLLDSSGAIISTAVTSAGQYLFVGGATDPNPNDSTGIVSGGIGFDTDLFVVIDPVNFNAGNPLENKLAATAFADLPGFANDQIRDSNGIITTPPGGPFSGGVIGHAFTTGGPGINDHSFDFGFVAPVMADISVTKVLNTTGPFVAGQSVQFTLTVTNNGPDTANNVLIDAVPTNLTITSVSSPNCAMLSCIVPSLASGASEVVTVTATINAAGTFDCAATAGADETDPVPDNNDDNDGDNATPAPMADIQVSKTLDSTGPFIIGQTVQLTLTATNNGPDTATNVLIDAVPTNLTITSVSSASCSMLPCMVSSLANGASEIITLMATINAAGMFDCAATAGADETDPVPDNNNDSDGSSAGAPMDFGDAPDSYGTTAGAGGASHVLDLATGVFLGACEDSEADGQPVAAGMPANGDDLGTGSSTLGSCAVSNDDEDGVVFNEMLVACNTADITITSAGLGDVNAWVDFNGDGDFDDIEQIANDLTMNPGTNLLTVNVPCDAVPQAVSYARFRISAEGGDGPTGPAISGEVEDYEIPIKGIDLGDAPDSYATMLVSGGPQHALDPAVPLYLGACVDSEADGQPSANADGDDLGAGIGTEGNCAVANDDEDGVVFNDMLIACNDTDITVTATQAGLLNAWIDFNGDDDFDAADQIATDLAVAAGANTITVNVPCSAIPQTTSYARFRVSIAGGDGPGGAAMTGEIEDHPVEIKGIDLGDAPDSYATTMAADGARHAVDSAIPLFLGSCVDTELDGQPNAAADGDDNGAGTSTLGTCVTANDDEEGINFTGMLFACGDADIDVTASQSGLLNAWIDFNGDGDFDAGDQIASDLAVAAGVNTITASVPCSAAPQATSYARFRISVAGGDGPTGLSMNGEVEDHTVEIKGIDLGDVPDSYGTTVATNGARHVLDPQTPVFLGLCVDSEADGQPSMNADGDDLGAGDSSLGSCAGNDDEDGVSFTTPLVIDSTNNGVLVDLPAGAGSQACVLNAWIDFDQSGNFGDSAGEQVVTDQALPAGSGQTALNIVIPPGVPDGDTYARFRCDSSGGLGPVDVAMDGEVEDYTVNVGGNADLALVKEADVQGVSQGGTFSYQLTVTNNGPGDAIDVVVTDMLPEQLSFISTSGCAEDPAGVPTCSLGDLANGASSGYSITVQVNEEAMGEIVNTAVVSASTVDPEPADNADGSSVLIFIEVPTLNRPGLLLLLLMLLALGGRRISRQLAS